MADQKQKQDTTIEWANSGGDEQITLNSLANGSAAQGDKHDFGSVFPVLASIELQGQPGVAPTAGNTWDVHWAWSANGTDFIGEAAGTAGKLVAARRNRTDWVGSMYLTNDTGTQHMGWEYYLPARWGVPIVHNPSGQAISSNGTGMWVRVTPLIGDIT